MMNDKTKKIISKTLSVLSIVCIVLLSLVLISNMIFIIKGAGDDELPPSAFGVTPLVVTSGSMDGNEKDSFPEGSMIFIKKSDGVAVGDIVSFFDPASRSGKVIVTHRIIEAKEVNGVLKYTTKGDGNNTADSAPITEDMVIGEYFFHIPFIGSFTLFMKDPLGMLLCIGLPILAFVVYDVLKKQKLEKQQSQKAESVEAMAAELERLRSLVGEANQKASEESEENTIGENNTETN